ncbi:MAG: HEPN domain-containing protein [Anaerolineae bacterium]
MDIKELEQQGLIESFAATLQEIDDLLEVARRDLTAARHMLPFDSDWSLAIAYNAALQAVLALMYAYDYRPRGANMHRTARDLSAVVLDERLRREISRLNRLRRKRHRTLYHEAGLVSQSAAENSLSFAERFVEDIQQVIAEKLRE